MMSFATFLALLAVAVVFFVGCGAERPFDSKGGDADGWNVPQMDGSFKWVTVDEYKRMKDNFPPDAFAVIPVKFFLYTRGNRETPQELYTDDPYSLTFSNFNHANPTRIIIHGWKNDFSSDVNVLVRQAFLEMASLNVICVDWSSKSQANYITAAYATKPVGKQVASFIDFLAKEGQMSFESLRVVGHSLGAHVSGHAGKNVQSGQIREIIGLDPALPLFSIGNPKERISESDAFYVESIHTCGGMLGFLEPIGKASFYPNGGKGQPGCGYDLAGTCAHSRAYIYYAEAIRLNSFITVKCLNYGQAVNKECGTQYSHTTKMGAPSNDHSAVGHFYVPVNEKAPFGKGGPLIPEMFSLVAVVHDSCLRRIRDHIRIKSEAGLVYLGIGAFFSHDSVNRPGFAEYFFDQVRRQRRHLEKLLEFLAISGKLNGDIGDFTGSKALGQTEWSNSIEAMEGALQFEKRITQSIRGMLDGCVGWNANVTVAYLDEQVKFEQELTLKLAALKKTASTHSGLGEFIYDKEL